MVTPSEFDTLIGSSWLTRPPSEERERVTEDERVGSVAIDDATKKKKKHRRSRRSASRSAPTRL
jgi:hypothetical protein